MIPRKTIAHYHITDKLGEGGMGEVWLATDSKLGREVAIKILPDVFARDPGRMARFEREAKVLASLNHPHIAQIYGVEERALIMELAEGDSPKGPMPIEKAWDIALQIAEALEYAHEKGVIHRDLKPANVKVTPDGKVKLLDFGLAKAFNETGDSIGSDPENSPTITFGGTVAGAILGTAAYMAPEQAKGKRVDKRCDIWAWGVMFYELLTGERLFQGATAADTMAQVLTREADLKRVPPQVRKLLRRCLEKDPKRRLRDIGDAADLLETDAEILVQGEARPRKLMWPVLAGLMGSLAVLAAWAPWRAGRYLPEGVVRLTMETFPAEMLGPEEFCCRPSYKSVAVSPDGKTVVFSGVTGASQVQLYKRALDQGNAIPLTGTAGAAEPFFSPDGQWIGFWAAGKLKKIPVAGGPALAICDVPTAERFSELWGASWSTAGDIAYVVDGTDLMKVSSSGGAPKMLAQAGSKGRYSTPEFLPDGKTLLLTLRTNGWDTAQVVAIRLDTLEQRVVLTGGADARYIPTGHLVYLQNGVLMAVPFDARRVQLTGAPVAMIDGVMQAINMQNFDLERGTGQFAVSASGNLVYAIGGIVRLDTATLVRVDRKGVETELNAPKGKAYSHPRLSPDGSRVAVCVLNGIASRDIWVIDTKVGTATRLTSEGTNCNPVWSPDGKRILFSDGLGFGYSHVLSAPADGSGTVETVITSQMELLTVSWPVDELPLIYLVGLREIWSRQMSGAGGAKRFLATRFDVTDADLSSDGRWIAYRSNESGASEIYVQAFPGPGEKHRISTSGGANAAWARNGRELFYLERRGPGKWAMMAVDFAIAGAFQAGAPHALFEGEDLAATAVSRSYDVTPDGQHFIMTRLGKQPEEHVSKLNVVHHWSEELKRRVPANKQ